MQMSAKMESGMVRLSASVPISDDVRKQPLLIEMPKEKHTKVISGKADEAFVFLSEVVRSPEPEELGEDGPDEAVDEDIRPHQLAGQLEGLEAGVVEQEESGPQKQQVEQTHKP